MLLRTKGEGVVVAVGWVLWVIWLGCGFYCVVVVGGCGDGGFNECGCGCCWVCN